MKLKTIEKILGYKPISEYNIELLKKGGFYNGTGADGIFFDDIIDAIFVTLEKSKIFDPEKCLKLRKDIEQLVIRHDIDTGFKIGFFRANKRLTKGMFDLLYKFPMKYRLIIRLFLFYVVNFTKRARYNYFTKK
ncbi:hypothetical protein GW846_03115 [Candidatus Gracilibacteria bacterium]|nr:hypothetical protein [Candidatus Gracilibacteria bacterium]